MAAGLTIKHKRKAGAFTNGELAAGEVGIDTSNSRIYYSADGSTVVNLNGLFQPIDSDLTTIAGLTATTDNFLVSVSSAWASRTPAQVKTTLSLNNVDNTSNATERAATRTLTNARITPRVSALGSSATPSINTDNFDFVDITGLATNITSMTSGLSGTPTNGQKLWIAITGTGARTISWGSSFEDGAVTLPTTTVSTTRLDTGFIWNSTTSKWRCMASG